jgi:hypothetical protein
MLARRSTVRRLEAENARLEAENAELDAARGLEREARGAAEAERDALQRRVNKLSESLRQVNAGATDFANGLAKEALDLVRFGPLFATTDPGVPSYTIDQVDQAERRLRTQLAQGFRVEGD